MDFPVLVEGRSEQTTSARVIIANNYRGDSSYHILAQKREHIITERIRYWKSVLLNKQLSKDVSTLSKSIDFYRNKYKLLHPLPSMMIGYVNNKFLTAPLMLT